MGQHRRGICSCSSRISNCRGLTVFQTVDCHCGVLRGLSYCLVSHLDQYLPGIVSLADCKLSGIDSLADRKLSGIDSLADCKIQGWEFAHSFILLKSIEQLWAICSRQMSDSEQIAQVAQRKWLTNLKLYYIFSLFYIGFLFKKLAIHSFPLFWWAMWGNPSGRSPKMSDHEQVNKRKWAIVCKSLRWLT